MSPRISLSRTSCAVVRSCGRDSATSKIARKSFSAPSASTGNCSLASSGAPCRCSISPQTKAGSTETANEALTSLCRRHTSFTSSKSSCGNHVLSSSAANFFTNLSFFDASIYPPVHGRWAGTSKMHTKSEAQERHTPLINFIHNGPTVSAQGVLAPSFIQAPGSPRQNFPGSPNHGPYTGTREKTLSHPRLKKPPSLRRRAQSFPNSSSVP